MITCNDDRTATATGTIERTDVPLWFFSPEQNRPMRRGRSYRTYGGAVGIFVGVTPSGSVWFAYEPESFAAMVARFDRMYAMVDGFAVKRPREEYKPSTPACVWVDEDAPTKPIKIDESE